MALCPHCWESLAEPVPAVCPKCEKPQPLHIDIPDAPTDDLFEPAPEPAEADPRSEPDRWSPADEKFGEAAPAPLELRSSPSGSPSGPIVRPSDPTKPRGALGLVVVVGAIIVVGALAAIPFDVAPRDDSGRVSGTGRAIEDQLAVGDCYGPDLELGESYGGAVTATPCEEPHLWEVVGRLTYPDDIYPGEAAMEQWAVDLCRKAFDQYVGEAGPNGDLQMWFRFPQQVHWDAGSRLSWCLATRGEPSTGSVRG